MCWPLLSEGEDKPQSLAPPGAEGLAHRAGWAGGEAGAGPLQGPGKETLEGARSSPWTPSKPFLQPPFLVFLHEACTALLGVPVCQRLCGAQRPHVPAVCTPAGSQESLKLP